MLVQKMFSFFTWNSLLDKKNLDKKMATFSYDKVRLSIYVFYNDLFQQIAGNH